MRSARLIAAALVWVAAIVASAGPTGAHEEVPGVRSVIDRVEPPLPAGVTIQAQISVADQLIAENRTPTDLFVLGEGGEPFLRIGPAGVFANVKSPSWFRSNDPTGAAVPPDDADPTAEPVFARVSPEPVWGWFDHRLHRGMLTRPPAVKDRDKPVVLESWTVPMRYGDQAVSVQGHREYKALTGVYTSRVTGAPAELRATALPGVVPAVTLSRAPGGSGGSEPVMVLGEAGEPMLRVGADASVEANDASPTWAFSQDAKGGYVRSGAVGVAEPPRWVRQASRSVTWLDRRGQLAPADGHEPKIGERKEWRIPVQVGERRAEIVGETSYVRLSAAPRRDGGGGGWPWWLSVLVGGAAGVLVMLIRGRVRMTHPSSSVGE